MSQVYDVHYTIRARVECDGPMEAVAATGTMRVDEYEALSVNVYPVKDDKDDPFM